MYIKYKGEIGSLLRDISLAYKVPINLKLSEAILQQFFMQIIKNINQEHTIELVCILPPFLKPFCKFSKIDLNNKQILGVEPNIAILPILNILKKYVSSEKMATIYSILPGYLFLDSTKNFNLPIAETKIIKVS